MEDDVMLIIKSCTVVQWRRENGRLCVPTFKLFCVIITRTTDPIVRGGRTEEQGLGDLGPDLKAGYLSGKLQD